jgi:hypothetical protein
MASIGNAIHLLMQCMYAISILGESGTRGSSPCTAALGVDYVPYLLRLKVSGRFPRMLTQGFSNKTFELRDKKR